MGWGRLKDKKEKHEAELQLLMKRFDRLSAMMTEFDREARPTAAEVRETLYAELRSDEE